MPRFAGRALALLLPLLSSGAALVAAQAPADDRVAALKAAFVLNFVRYTSWPAESFAEPDAPILVRVVGDDGLATALAELAGRAAPVEGRRLEVRTAPLAAAGTVAEERLVAELREAHVLVVGRSFPPGRLPPLLEALAGAPVLTVSDFEGFAAEGGMLALVEDKNRIVFDANPAAISASNLMVSARVLKLARVLEGETR